MSALLLADEHARLIESGADRDPRIPLAKVFVDLQATLCAGRLPTSGSALHQLVSPVSTEDRAEPVRVWILLGGAGAGKSTVTAMAAQILRAQWVSAQPDAVPMALREGVDRVVAGVRDAAARCGASDAERSLPVRINLPSLARWLVGHRAESTGASLYDHLAATMSGDLRAVGQDVACSGPEMRAMVHAAGRISWLFDGLDEVPTGELRLAVSRVVQEVIATRRPGDCSVVTTRPQGYGGEFDDHATMELDGLAWPVARDFCKRLVKASSMPMDGQELNATLDREFNRPEVQALARAPLHAAIVASFIARSDELPRARWELFERYFNVLFDRELRKLSAAGIKTEQRAKVFELHARVGLALHVRAQVQPAATLSVRELRAMLVAFYQEDGLDEELADERSTQLLRFSSERLVLLLRVAEGGYAFGIRPLQEFFAARALWTPDAAVLRQRLDAVAVSPHWSNVLATLSSGAAVAGVDAMTRRAALVLVDVCRALNDGSVGGAASARCLLGSRVAISLLREVGAYAAPWLLDPLWHEALRIAEAPVQRDALEWARRPDDSGRGEGVSAVWDDDLEVHVRLGELAFNATAAFCGRWRADVLTRAARLMTGREGDRWAAWHLLLPGLRDNQPDALESALAGPPSTRDEAAGFVQCLLWEARYRQLPKVVIDLIALEPGWFSPCWLYAAHRGRWHDDATWPPALRIAALLSRVAPRGFSVPLLGSKKWTAAMEVVPLAGQPQQIWEQIAVLAMQGTPQTRLWTKIALFHREPTAAHLADVLVDLDSESFEEVVQAREIFAWPLAACLAYADAPEQLGEVVTALRTGTLGDTEAWLTAESRWREVHGLEATAWSRWVSELSPWSLDDVGPPITRSSFTSLWFEPSPGPKHYRETILRALASHGPRARRALWAVRQTSSEFLELALWESGVPREVAMAFRTHHPSTKGSRLPALNLFLPELIGEEGDRWHALLDEFGREGRIATVNAPRGRSDPRIANNIQQIAHHITNHPARWGLGLVLLALLNCQPDAPLDALRLSPPPPGMTAHGAAWRNFLTLLSTPSGDPLSLMHDLHGLQDGEPFDYRPGLAAILARRTRDPDRTEALLLAALDSTKHEDYLTREPLLGALLAHLRRSAALAFTDARTWETTLHFAPPHIAMQPTMPTPPSLISIDALTNLRLFRETPVVASPFPKPMPDRGQWIVLLGENGVGKTTLLRGLALALVAPEVGSKQLHSRLPLVRNGGPASIAFTLSTGTFRAAVNRVDGGATETVTLVGDAPSERPWVVGYGVRRGGALGEEGRVVDWATEGNLHTLFERQPALAVAQDWLLKLDRRVQRERVQGSGIGGVLSSPAGDLWSAVVAALKRALEVSDLTAGDDDVVYVEHRDFGRVRMESLSDGYLVTAGWIIDLIARWVRQREVDGDVLSGDILGQMTGLVLIDEIDLHLHPRWQMRVIDDVRRIFPRLSFVVTTHNPLTLQGARPGEVFIMSRGDEGRINLAQRDIQPGYDIDRVLLEQFGIEHTFDRETREWLREHRQIMVAGGPPDDPRRAELERMLADRLGSFGEAVVAQRGGGGLSEVQRSNLERFKARRGSGSQG